MVTITALEQLKKKVKAQRVARLLLGQDEKCVYCRAMASAASGNHCMDCGRFYCKVCEDHLVNVTSLLRGGVSRALLCQTCWHKRVSQIVFTNRTKDNQ